MWLKPQSREILIPVWKLFYFWHWKELDRPGKPLSDTMFQNFNPCFPLRIWKLSTFLIPNLLVLVDQNYCQACSENTLLSAYSTWYLFLFSWWLLTTYTQFWHCVLWNSPFLDFLFFLTGLLFSSFYFLLCSVKHTSAG